MAKKKKTKTKTYEKMEKIVSLSKRRGFVFQSSSQSPDALSRVYLADWHFYIFTANLIPHPHTH